MTYTIWHDADYDIAYWVYRNSVLKSKDVLIRSMPKSTKASTLKKIIKDDSDVGLLPMIKYDHPDIVITKNGQPICVTEFMTHTPQWQHPAQRFARIYGSVSHKIPAVLIAPNRKTKLERKGKEYTSVSYKLSDSVKYLFKITEKISGTPTRIFEWGDLDGYLKLDKKSPTAPYKDKKISEWFSLINSIVLGNEIPADTSKPLEPNIDNFTTIRGIENTRNLLDENNINSENLTCELFQESLVFKPNGLSPPSSYFRTDPYAGMLCAFDNMFCRDQKTGKRNRNLVLIANCVELNKLRESGNFYDNSNHNDESCPFESFTNSRIDMLQHLNEGCIYTSSKQHRIYGQISDLIIFDDKNYSQGKIV